MTLSTLSIKFVWMAIIFSATTILGLLPILLKNSLGRTLKKCITASTRDRIMSCAGCFTAGIFLYVCFMGLLPSADSKFHKILAGIDTHHEHGWEMFAEFPWGFFLVTIGFLVIFSIDQLVHAAEADKKMKEGKKIRFIVEKLKLSPSDSNLLSGSQEDHSDHKGHGVPSSLVFLIALGIHSLFEGAAIGLQTEKEKLLEFGVAVMIHEALMALSFGMEVSKSTRLSTGWKVVYVLLFTASIPVGIGIGAALMENSDSGARMGIAAVMEAFATGIFIHVIFVEILAKEFGHGTDHNTEKEAYEPCATDEENSDTSGSQDTKKVKDESGYGPFETKNGDDEGLREEKTVSHVCLVVEKIISMAIGLALLIILGIFMHAAH